MEAQQELQVTARALVNVGACKQLEVAQGLEEGRSPREVRMEAEAEGFKVLA